MVALITLLVVGVLSWLFVRIGATALEMTGLSRDAARFQALSAFFGAGFTTEESELVVNHPVRRRVVRDLIVIGQLGVLSAVGGVVSSTLSARPPGGRAGQYGLLIGSLLALWLISRSRLVERVVDRSIRAAIERAGVVRALDYAQLLGVHEGYEIAEVFIEEDNPLAGTALADSQLRQRGVVVLGMLRPDGSFLGAPRGTAVIEPLSTLIVYGKRECVQALMEGAPPLQEEQEERAVVRSGSLSSDAPQQESDAAV